MGPITYSLCQKPVIGFVMLAASLCVFPPLIPAEPFPLDTAGATVTKEFEVPVDKQYTFELVFEFPSGANKLNDKLVGAWPHDYCDVNAKYEQIYEHIPEPERSKMGQPIPIRIVVRKSDDHAIVMDRTLMTLCSSGSTETVKRRPIGRVSLGRGKYIAEITNLESQSQFEGVKTRVTLVSGHGK